MWEKINNFLKGQIVTSIIYIALGACLVFMPVSTVNIICKFIFGILLILVGLYHILIYVAEKLNSTIFDLFSGGVLMVLGIFLFMNPQIVVKLLPVLLGTFILVDSIWTLKGSIKLKKRGAGSWKFLLIGSVIFIALGISLVVNPFTMVKYTVIFAGWIFLCNGVIDLIYLILMKRGLKELKQDVEAVDADGKILAEEGDAADSVETENAPQPDEVVQPEPEYALWSSRKKKETSEEILNEKAEEDLTENSETDFSVKSDEDTSVKETFDTTQEISETYTEEREVSDMEESLDAIQLNEEETAVEEDAPPAGQGAYVVSEPTVTDEDLSDTKDENLLGFFARKRKKDKDSEE